MRRSAERDKIVRVTNFASCGKSQRRRSYFFAPAGGVGTRSTPWHFPVPVLFPVARPDEYAYIDYGFRLARSSVP